MDLFQWKVEYEIGLPKIDAQHRQIVDMLNELHAAKQSDSTPQAIEKTLDGLLQYTRQHFADEEAAMREADYPKLDTQRRQHLNMTDEVLKLRSEMEQGAEPATFELLNFMSEWLKLHIAGADKEFGDYILSQEQQRENVNHPDDAHS